MPDPVVVNAEMGLASVLKPPRNFENVYEGLDPALYPIALPGTLDFRAGDRGFDSNLMAGLPIPLGSRVLFWFPAAYTSEGFSMPTYTWRILWRLRSTGDKAERDAQGNQPQKGLVGHLPVAFEGLPADGGAAPGDPTQERIVIPCAISSVAYEQTEPAGSADATINLRGEDVIVQGNSYNTTNAPIRVDNAAVRLVAEQGLYPFPQQDNGRTSGPRFLPYMVDAMGDELILLVNRTGVNWDFGGADFLFSQIFGTSNGTVPAPLPGLGVYVMTGTGAT